MSTLTRHNIQIAIPIVQLNFTLSYKPWIIKTIESNCFYIMFFFIVNEKSKSEGGVFLDCNQNALVPVSSALYYLRKLPQIARCVRQLLCLLPYDWSRINEPHEYYGGYHVMDIKLYPVHILSQ